MEYPQLELYSILSIISMAMFTTSITNCDVHPVENGSSTVEHMATVQFRNGEDKTSWKWTHDPCQS